MMMRRFAKTQAEAEARLKANRGTAPVLSFGVLDTEMGY
jgi:hypothetical protein